MNPSQPHLLTPAPRIYHHPFLVSFSPGPKILSPIRNREDMSRLTPMHDVAKQVPFLGPILSSLRKEVEGKTSLIGR